MTIPSREERFLCFDTVRELNEFVLSSENRGRWIYAHAGGLADMEFVLDDLLVEIKQQLDSRTNLARVFISEELKAKGIDKIEDTSRAPGRFARRSPAAPPSSSTSSKGKNAWHFLDSYWLLRDELASIGKAIGIKKGDSPPGRRLTEKFGRFNKDFDDLARREE